MPMCVMGTCSSKLGFGLGFGLELGLGHLLLEVGPPPASLCVWRLQPYVCDAWAPAPQS